MKAFLICAAGGPLVILTSHKSVTDATLLDKLAGKGIEKFIAFEVPLETAKERYGAHFAVVEHDLRETDDLRILDYNGQRAFGLFPFNELSAPILYEGTD